MAFTMHEFHIRFPFVYYVFTLQHYSTTPPTSPYIYILYMYSVYIMVASAADKTLAYIYFISYDYNNG